MITNVGRNQFSAARTNNVKKQNKTAFGSGVERLAELKKANGVIGQGLIERAAYDVWQSNKTPHENSSDWNWETAELILKRGQVILDKIKGLPEESEKAQKERKLGLVFNLFFGQPQPESKVDYGKLSIKERSNKVAEILKLKEESESALGDFLCSDF